MVQQVSLAVPAASRASGWPARLAAMFFRDGLTGRVVPATSWTQVRGAEVRDALQAEARGGRGRADRVEEESINRHLLHGQQGGCRAVYLSFKTRSVASGLAAYGCTKGVVKRQAGIK
eukprot:970009-Pleurochrysis_carterae.AAC.1